MGTQLMKPNEVLSPYLGWDLTSADSYETFSHPFLGWDWQSSFSLCREWISKQRVSSVTYLWSSTFSPWAWCFLCGGRTLMKPMSSNFFENMELMALYLTGLCPGDVFDTFIWWLWHIWLVNLICDGIIFISLFTNEVAVSLKMFLLEYFGI